MDPKQGRIYGKGTPFKRAPQRFGEEISPNSPPPGSASVTIYRGFKQGFSNQV